MTFEDALDKVVSFLKENHGATNRVLIELIDGDTGLFEKVRDHLIFNDMAEDKKGVGLIFTCREDQSKPASKPIEELTGPEKTETSESASGSFRIFVSYGRKDAEELANKIASDLTGLGHEVWIDKEQIKTGRSWEEQIEEAILTHDIFISLLTPYAVRRPDGVCLDEISMARFHNRKIVPVMVVQCRPPLSIYRLDWVDFQEWTQSNSYKRSFLRIVKALKEQTNVEGSYADIFSRLKPLDFGVDVSRMTKDFTGRQWLFDEFDYWLKQSSGRVFIISGDPGIGKSAVMAQLACKHPQVMAFHFCISSLADSVNPDVFVKSIAAQLATQIKEYHDTIRQLNFEQLTRLDPGTLFRRLIADPLKSINLKEQVVILVDALDESWTETGDNIVRVLHDRIEDLPENVKLMVSSRKIPDILDLLSRYKPHEIDPACLENIHDIADYLDKKFIEKGIAERIRSREQDIIQIKKMIIRKSEGNFLYVKQFIYGIETERIDINNPSSFPDGLTGIYISFFDRIFSKQGSYDDFRPLLEVITCLKKPFSAKELSHIVQLSEFEIRRRMQTLSAFFPERNGRFSPYHKSVTDWLTGESCSSKRYLLDIERGRKVICEYLLKLYSQGDFNSYLLTYIPYHLLEAEKYDELIDLLLDFDFIIQKCSQLMIYELIKDYHAAFTILPETRDIKQEEKEYTEMVSKYTSHLISDPCKIQNGEIKIESLVPWTESQIDCEIKRIRNSPNKRDILKIFLQFLDAQAHLLFRYGNIEGFLLQQAYNSSDSGPLAAYVQTCLRKCNHLKLLFTHKQREEFNPFFPCIRILQEHTERVLGVSITSDGKFAVSGSRDNSLKFWDLQSGECLKTVKPHIDYLHSLDATPDLNLVATSGGTQDPVIHLWNYKDLEPRGDLEGHTDRVNDLKITPDGRYIISGSNDDTVKVWETTTRTCIADFNKHTDDVICVDISLDGKTGVSGGYDNAVYLWDIEGRKCIRAFEGINDLGYAVKLSINNKILFTCGGFNDKSIRVWDLNTGNCITTMYGHEYAIHCLETTHDGKYLVSGSTDKTIKVWNLQTFKCVKTIEGHVGSIISMKITPEMKYIISGGGGLYNDNTVRLWDIYKSKLPSEEFGLCRNIGHIYFCKPANFILNSTRKVIQLRYPETGSIVNELRGHKAHIKQVKTDHEGRRIISGSLDKTIRIWDMLSGECVNILEGHTDGILDISISEDQKKMASCGWDKQIREWDFNNYQKINVYQGHDNPVIQIAYLGSDKNLLSLSTDNVIRLWDTKTGNCLIILQIAVNITTRIVSGSNDFFYFGCNDGTIRYHNMQTPEMFKELKGHTGLVSSLELDKEEHMLFSGSSDTTICQWDLITGDCIKVFTGHLGEVSFIRRVPGQNKIITAARDHTIRVWDLLTGRCIAVLSTNLLINCITPVQEDRMFAYGTMQGEFKIVELSEI